MIVALRTPLLFLLTHGVSAGVLNEGMLKHALCKNLTGSKHLLGNWSLNDAVRDISKHFMYCIAMLRAVKREDAEAGDRRRYPKSGGFRRKLGMHEHDVVDQLTQAMIIDAIGNVDEGESVGESHVVDEDPWPECFAMSCIADEKMMLARFPQILQMMHGRISARLSKPRRSSRSTLALPSESELHMLMMMILSMMLQRLRSRRTRPRNPEERHALITLCISGQFQKFF